MMLNMNLDHNAVDVLLQRLEREARQGDHEAQHLLGHLMPEATRAYREANQA